MNKIVVMMLIACLGGQGFALELAGSTLWSGDVKLTDDVVVPVGSCLTLAPGTQVTTNGHKIIGYGSVKIAGRPDRPVNFRLFPAGSAPLETVKVKPYDINTAILKEEFGAFKVQYAILWSLLFASTFFMLEAR